jgi:hypothetical protein
MDEKDLEKINRLIKEILDEEDDERRLYLAENIPDADPWNAVAKYVKWQSTDGEDPVQDTRLLEEAVESLRPTIESLDEELDNDSEIYALYVSMLSDLASFLYVSGERDRAFAVAEEFMRRDNECLILGRMVYYAVLVERGRFGDVIRAAADDICETPPGEYCRAIAAFESDDYDGKAAEYLLGAISMDPDLPYYILGLWTIDDGEMENEDDGYIEDMMMTVAVLSELWAANDERLAFLSTVAFAFGYITGRVEGPDDITMIEDGYRELGCLDVIQESRDILHAMLASGRGQDEVDEEAISLFRQNGHFGLLE